MPDVDQGDDSSTAYGNPKQRQQGLATEHSQPTNGFGKGVCQRWASIFTHYRETDATPITHGWPRFTWGVMGLSWAGALFLFLLKNRKAPLAPIRKSES